MTTGGLLTEAEADARNATERAEFAAQRAQWKSEEARLWETVNGMGKQCEDLRSRVDNSADRKVKNLESLVRRLQWTVARNEAQVNALLNAQASMIRDLVRAQEPTPFDWQKVDEDD